MRKLVFAVALGATMVASQAFAKDHGGQRGAWMQDMTRAQAQQMADAMFQRFDANHDGVVTRQEAEQAASQFGAGGRAQKMLDRAFGQAQSLTLARFDRDDLNHDGTVTAAERQQARAALKADRAGQPQQVPPPPPSQ
jgi:hypothetical protein